MPQRDRRLFTPPVASLPKRESRGKSRPQNIMLTRMVFSTPSHFCTAQRGSYALAYPSLELPAWLRISAYCPQSFRTAESSAAS